MTIFAAVEGGGTSRVVVLVEDKPDNIIEREQFVTETPIITPAVLSEGT